MPSAASLVARAARSKKLVAVDNVQEAEDWLANPLLPHTCAEMAVPIIREGEVIGVLDVQADILAHGEAALGAQRDVAEAGDDRRSLHPANLLLVEVVVVGNLDPEVDGGTRRVVEHRLQLGHRLPTHLSDTRRRRDGPGPEGRARIGAG